MPENATKLVVVTDLDGTLLDHHTYSYEPVRPLMRDLREAGIPVIANTSKTKGEWLEMAVELRNHDPFVVENGSAIYFPNGECVVFGERREKILSVLKKLRKNYHFEGYADWDIDEIMERTSLDRESATHSADREFSEPLIWMDDEAKKAEFCAEVHAAGLNTLQGGRFLHVLGQTDKGKAVDFLRGRMDSGSKIIALGDGPNDIAMLKAADIGIVIATPTGRKLEFESNNQIIHSTLLGPKGWAETLAPLFNKFSRTTTN